MRQAVKQNGTALEYASEDLRGDHDIVLEVPSLSLRGTPKGWCKQGSADGRIYKANRCAFIDGTVLTNRDSAKGEPILARVPIRVAKHFE